MINGVNPADLLGISVGAAGDINGDGIDDLLIGADGAGPNGLYSGASYVVFGSNQGFSTPLNLSTLNGANGFVINGVKYDSSGASVSGAGDINDDGIDDVMVGATLASYVIFGSDVISTDGFE